jgi:DNA-binding transcriptional LysR family regulator
VVERAAACVVLPEGRPLAQRETLALRDIAGEDLIFLRNASEPDIHAKFTERCLAAGFEPRYSLASSRAHCGQRFAPVSGVPPVVWTFLEA